MGTHDELVQIEGGKYAHLFRLQSEGYVGLNTGKTISPSGEQIKLEGSTSARE
jgi:hypothetical protein